jgi:hypothetical protein
MSGYRVPVTKLSGLMYMHDMEAADAGGLARQDGRRTYSSFLIPRPASSTATSTDGWMMVLPLHGRGSAR